MGVAVHPPALCKASASTLLVSVVRSLTETYDDTLFDVLRQVCQHNFVITDPHMPGHPIVYASNGFLNMSGYLAEEVVGRNPKFLQGPDTDHRTVLQIRDAVCEERGCHVVILNYTKQGWPFWTELHMAPIFSKGDRTVAHFVGVQSPLPCYAAPSLSKFLQGVTCTAANTSESCGKPFCGKYSLATCLDAEALGSFRATCTKDRSVAGMWPTSQHCEAFQCKPATVLHSLVGKLLKCRRQKSCEATCRTNKDTHSENVICSPLTHALKRIQQSFVLSNPHLPGMPIVYASDPFLRLSGYCRDEVLGRNCTFLQGPDTDPNVVRQIEECIKQEQACTVRILNYRKDKSSFWNLLHVAPVRDSRGKVAFFVGVQLDTSSNATNSQTNGVIAPLMQHLGVVGAVKVVIRSLHNQGLERVRVSGS